MSRAFAKKGKKKNIFSRQIALGFSSLCRYTDGVDKLRKSKGKDEKYEID